MLQGIYKAAGTANEYTWYVSTEDRRIDTSVTTAHIQFLVKFTNDMDKSIQYAYGALETIYSRYTAFRFEYNINPDIFTGKTKLFPAGYWKYECYEVSWTGVVSLVRDKAPSTETEVLPAEPDHGIVQGLVTKGKMYVAEKDGTEQVQYTQRQEPDGTNYIYYGQ